MLHHCLNLADMMIALCYTPAKSYPWHQSIFWLMINITVNNAWGLHLCNVETIKKQNLKGFWMEVAKALHYPEKGTRGRFTKHHQNEVIKQPKCPQLR